jgi:hypothetical protein
MTDPDAYLHRKWMTLIILMKTGPNAFAAGAQQSQCRRNLTHSACCAPTCTENIGRQQA